MPTIISAPGIGDHPRISQSADGSPVLRQLPPAFAATRESLHLVAERIVAPARKPDNEIALEPTPGGFGTPEFEHEGAIQRVRVDGVELVREIDGEARRAPLDSLAAAGRIVSDLVPSAAELGDAPLEVDLAASQALADWYAFGSIVLGRVIDEAEPGDDASPPILWPEHFDLAIELGAEGEGERATYGFSPGDEAHPQPYAYVGPWTAPAEGELWQATGFRGAELGYTELLAAADAVDAALGFLRARRDALRRIAADG